MSRKILTTEEFETLKFNPQAYTLEMRVPVARSLIDLLVDDDDRDVDYESLTDALDEAQGDVFGKEEGTSYVIIKITP
jgi:hypothetical protein